MSLLPPANVVCEGYVFTPVCDSINSGEGSCVAGGHVWLGYGACVAGRGACMEKGDICDKGGACVAKGGCMVKGAMRAKGGVCGMHAPLYKIQPVNARAVRILLEYLHNLHGTCRPMTI